MRRSFKEAFGFETSSDYSDLLSRLKNAAWHLFKKGTPQFAARGRRRPRRKEASASAAADKVKDDDDSPGEVATPKGLLFP